MSEELTPPKTLATKSFKVLNRAGSRELMERWDNLANHHKKAADETDDPDKKQYFESMSAPYREAADYMKSLLKGKD